MRQRDWNNWTKKRSSAFTWVYSIALELGPRIVLRGLRLEAQLFAEAPVIFATQMHVGSKDVYLPNPVTISNNSFMRLGIKSKFNPLKRSAKNSKKQRQQYV
ncbi:hypothetical protein CEXT_50641 [Caerostris extrusa]|uniref:Uncharacterized protein n=1 Tax=Caerostris extrusa TaxID=172846 RepID=A0AAV4WZ79_CAEEX|nr:hypothetical protein CEXT_50641 [Caerostris extrusa]